MFRDRYSFQKTGYKMEKDLLDIRNQLLQSEFIEKAAALVKPGRNSCLQYLFY
jgi:hypothetical protein